MAVLLAILLLALTTLLLLAQNNFKAQFDNLIFFNLEVSIAAIFLKP